MNQVTSLLNTLSSVLTLLFIAVFLLWLFVRLLKRFANGAASGVAVSGTLDAMQQYRPGLPEEVIRQTISDFQRTGRYPRDETGQDIVFTYERYLHDQQN